MYNEKKTHPLKTPNPDLKMFVEIFRKITSMGILKPHTKKRYNLS